MKIQTILKILAVLAVLASLSIPMLSYASVNDGESEVVCTVKGFAIHPTHLEVFVNIQIYQGFDSFKLPVNEFSDSIRKAVSDYRTKQGLERFTDDKVTVKILKFGFK